MAIEDDIIHGQVFGAGDKPDKTVSIKIKAPKTRSQAKTMAEATAGLKSLNTSRTKSKSGSFAKGTHGSGAAKMRAEYKSRKRKESAKRAGK